MDSGTGFEISEIALNTVLLAVNAVFASPFGIIAAWYAFGA